jgi:hypothetical protein
MIAEDLDSPKDCNSSKEASRGPDALHIYESNLTPATCVLVLLMYSYFNILKPSRTNNAPVTNTIPPIINPAQRKGVKKKPQSIPNPTKNQPPTLGHFQEPTAIANTINVNARCETESARVKVGLNPSIMKRPKNNTTNIERNLEILRTIFLSFLYKINYTLIG